MSFLIGLEKEFFIAKSNNGTVYQDDFASAEEAELLDACDECGYLAEIRGEPKNNIISAVFSLREEEFKLRRRLKKGFILSVQSFAKLPKKFLYQVRRANGKGAAHDECLYGTIKEKSLQAAGMHIHFSCRNKETIHCTCGKEYHQWHETQMNMPHIIRSLDDYFAAEIKEAKRQKGIYEMKPWGFEYRSLPNNIDEIKLIKFFEESKLF